MIGEEDSPPSDVQTSRSYGAERQNFAHWSSFYRKRLSVAKGAMTTVITRLQGVQICNYGINQNVVQPVFKVNVGSTDETETQLNTLYGLEREALGTPLRRGLESLGKYFHAQDGGDGNIGPSTYAASAEGGECQRFFAIVMTDGFYNGADPGMNNEDGDNPAPYADNYLKTLADVAMYYYEKGRNPSRRLKC